MCEHPCVHATYSFVFESASLSSTLKVIGAVHIWLLESRNHVLLVFKMDSVIPTECSIIYLKQRAGWAFGI